MEDFLRLLSRQATQISAMEWLAVAFGLLQVLLAWRNSIWNYIAGIVATALTIRLMLASHLFAEAGLNVYYLLISLWGFWRWRQRQARQHIIHPTFATRHEWLVTAGISLGGTVLIYGLLRAFTPSDVPLWDASVSALAWAGTWLLTRRKVENWLVLNASNALAVPLLIHKDLWLFAVFTALLFVLALLGYRDWRRLALSGKTAPTLAG